MALHDVLDLAADLMMAGGADWLMGSSSSPRRRRIWKLFFGVAILGGMLMLALWLLDDAG